MKVMGWGSRVPYEAPTSGCYTDVHSPVEYKACRDDGKGKEANRQEEQPCEINIYKECKESNFNLVPSFFKVFLLTNFLIFIFQTFELVNLNFSKLF